MVHFSTTLPACVPLLDAASHFMFSVLANRLDVVHFVLRTASHAPTARLMASRCTAMGIWIARLHWQSKCEPYGCAASGQLVFGSTCLLFFGSTCLLSRGVTHRCVLYFLQSRGTEQTLSRCDAVVMTRVSAASQQDVSNDHAHEVTGHWQMERPVHCGRDEAVQIELHLAPVDGRAPQVSGLFLAALLRSRACKRWHDVCALALLCFAATSVVTPVRGLVALLPPSTKLPAGVNLNEQLRLSGHGQTEATEVHFEVPESRFPGSAYTALQHAVTVAFHEVRIAG